MSVVVLSREGEPVSCSHSSDCYGLGARPVLPFVAVLRVFSGKCPERFYDPPPPPDLMFGGYSGVTRSGPKAVPL